MDTREVKIIHKLLLYGADARYSDLQGETCATLLETLDDDLKNSCRDLFANIGQGSRRNQGLLYKGKSCLDRTGKKKNKRLLLCIFGALMTTQFLLYSFYIFPIVKGKLSFGS